jgi:hypothetical protein
MRDFESESLWMYYFVLYFREDEDMSGYSLYGSKHGEYIGEGRSIPEVIYEVTI